MKTKPFFHSGKALLFLFLVAGALHVRAQETKKDKFYRFTLGAGLGKGYPDGDGNGIGATIKFAYQQSNQLFGLEINGVSEIEIFHTNVTNSVRSINLSCGRAYSLKSLCADINAGLGFVTSKEAGELIATGGFFGPSVFQKITKHAIGLALSADISRLSTVAGAGVELFANINNKYSFGGFNICLQLGKLRKPKIKAHQKNK